MAIKVQNTTVINDSRQLENITNLKTVNSQSILGAGDISITGIPTAGTTGQVLTKNSSTNYDVSWVNPGNEITSTVTSSAGAATINTSLATVFLHSLTENTTYTFSNPPASGTGYIITLKIVQNSTPRTITWPASVKWVAASPPTLSTGSGDVDVFAFFTHDAGTNWYGFVTGQDLS
jgi:hypothetical protein